MVDSPDSNGIAAALAPAVIIGIYYFWVNERWMMKLHVAIVCAYLLNATVQVGSRGAFVGILVGTVVFMSYLFFSSAQQKNQKRNVIFAAVFGIMAVISVTDAAFWDRMSTIKDDSELTTEVQSGSTRVFFWKATWEMAKDYLFGTGSSGFMALGGLYMPEGLNSGGSRSRAVHSTWFETLNEIGYAGLFALIMIVWFAISTTNKCKKVLKDRQDFKNYFKVIAIQCAFIAFIGAMTFLNRLRAEILYWCIMYTACAYNIYYLKRESLQNNAK